MDGGAPDRRVPTAEAVVVAFARQQWLLRRGQCLVFGRSRSCNVQLPDDDHLSRTAGSLQIVDDCVLVRNLSSTKPLVLRPDAGEDRVIEPSAATTSLPDASFRLVLAGRGGSVVEIAVDARAVTPPSRPVGGMATRSSDTVTAPMTLTAAQHRVLVVLSAPLLTERGPKAVPATYTHVGEVLGLSPQYVRNVVKTIREGMSGHGIPGLTSDDDMAPHEDFRWSLARSAVRNGWVTEPDVAALLGGTGLVIDLDQADHRAR